MYDKVGEEGVKGKICGVWTVGFFNEKVMQDGKCYGDVIVCLSSCGSDI